MSPEEREALEIIAGPGTVPRDEDIPAIEILAGLLTLRRIMLSVREREGDPTRFAATLRRTEEGIEQARRDYAPDRAA